MLAHAVNDSSSDPTARRISFRRRLVVSQGLVLTVAFVIIGILSWLVTYGWLHYHAWALLEREAVEINFHIVGLDGELSPDRYTWHEPHHLYREKRLDPYFAQIFDTKGAIVYASGNTRLFTTPFPNSLVAYQPSAIGAISALNTIEIDGEALYFGNYPILGRNEQVIGSLQIARYEPDIPGRLRKFALGISMGLVALLAILLVLTDRVAFRALGPLRSITSVADALSPNRMDERIPVPADADWETTRLAETLNALLDRLGGAFENCPRAANSAHGTPRPCRRVAPPAALARVVRGNPPHPGGRDRRHEPHDPQPTRANPSRARSDPAR
jgi:HAMP domain-containing protein